MKEIKTARIRFSYGGKAYAVIVNSICYAERLIINKLRLGYTHIWLVFQNGNWRFIGDMPLCKQLKAILVRKLAAFHGLSAEQICADEQVSLRTGILLNAVLNILAVKKELPNGI